MSKVELLDLSYNGLREIEWDFINSEQDLLSTLHPYPAKFIPNIPKELIIALGCPKNAVVFDPFCGSGTTLVESLKLGYDAIGIDLNPIACLISKVKTRNLPSNYICVSEEVVSAARKIYENQIVVPKIPNLDHWFKKEVQKSLAALLQQIELQNDEILREALKLALSSIIVRVSNQESDTRYAAINNNYNADDVFNNFFIACKKINVIKNSIGDFSNKALIIQDDILKIKKSDIKRNIGLVITSPPYPNAYEYWLYHKYRMWWLGFDPIQVRTYEIGARPHYQKKNGQTEKDFYFQMDAVFDLLISKLVYGGHICFVIGRSIIKGREVDNASLIMDIGRKHNLTIIANIERQIAATKKSFNLKYGKIKTENILIFRKD